LLALEEERHIDPARTVRAWSVDGGIGSIIALSANISGAAGLQNEEASASMGAGAVAYMMGAARGRSPRRAIGLRTRSAGLRPVAPGRGACVKRNAIFAVHGLTRHSSRFRRRIRIRYATIAHRMTIRRRSASCAGQAVTERYRVAHSTAPDQAPTGSQPGRACLSAMPRRG